VHDATGAWVDGCDAARELGSFFVVTSDNPYSQVLSDAENTARRDELEYVLRSRGADVRPSVASDPAGQWPVEMGFAVFDVSADFARTLARTFDQFAFYDVTPDGVRVLSSFDASAID
jgi:hypothetical protein